MHPHHATEHSSTKAITFGSTRLDLLQDRRAAKTVQTGPYAASDTPQPAPEAPDNQALYYHLTHHHHPAVVVHLQLSLVPIH